MEPVIQSVCYTLCRGKLILIGCFPERSSQICSADGGQRHCGVSGNSAHSVDLQLTGRQCTRILVYGSTARNGSCSH